MARQQKIYQVDAFTDQLFSGNPAAVCPLNHWLEDELMQKIAMENNLAETAFFVKAGDQYQIRWFTPTTEVDLCGHATLASAYVIFNIEKYQEDNIHFYSHRSGELNVSKKGDLLTLNFPADVLTKTVLNTELSACFNIQPVEVYRGKSDFMLVYSSEEEILNLQPNMDQIAKIEARGLIVTARGKQVDFVSRFFGPQSGVPEDPVTGSAHTSLTPYWAKQLQKKTLTAMQLSQRRGRLTCADLGDRIEISGQARLYLQGEIYLA